MPGPQGLGQLVCYHQLDPECWSRTQLTWEHDMFKLLPVGLGTDAGFWELSPFLRGTIVTGTLEVALPEVSILSDASKHL